MATVLVLGAGRVTGPLFEYLHQREITFSVVSCINTELEHVKGKYPAVACYCLDVSDPQLPTLIENHKLIVNLFPCTLTFPVAKMCVDLKRPMISASYVSPEVQELHERAVESGVLLLYECGLDPGIDHMLAMQVINDVVSRGGKVTSFTSWCGGLPAPECCNNPLKYKFSWNPKTALKSCLRDAACIRSGQLVKIPGGDTLRSSRQVDMGMLLPDVQFEGYPNELSQHHIEAYGLQSADYIFRGTLRYLGFSDAVQGLIQAGLFSETPLPQLQPEFPDITWKDLLCCMVTGSAKADDLERQLLSKLNESESRLSVLKGLGLLSDTIVEKKLTPFDTFAAYLEKHLAYAPGERDMTIMQHEITATLPGQQSRKETTRVGLCAFGDPDGHSAMAKTVGYTVGIGVEMILKGEIQKTGVVLPTTADMYMPMLAALRQLGITAQVSVEAGHA
ncbi:hypothetical protein BaRGS_00008834 [Batillaria attramentaria]|uniref:Uncharacterized protein n=1 Tax=Batillaria attramentaria TaxID=370345 RepID=A0ABD0LL67_9CAEN